MASCRTNNTENSDANFTKEPRVSFSGDTLDNDHCKVTIRTPSATSKNKKHKHDHFLPKPFERSNGSLLNPKFDSEILENYLQKCYFPQAKRLFRHIVYYVTIASFCWLVFFGLKQIKFKKENWLYFVGGSSALLAIMLTLLFITCTRHYAVYSKSIAYILAVILVITVQLPYVFESPDISPVGTFCGVVEILILLYSFFPINLFAAAGLGCFLSISYEIIIALRYPEMCKAYFIISKLLLHLIVHLIGTFIYIMSNTRARSSFSKIGQSVSAQRDLMIEREIKEKMIHSLMPPVVARSVMAAHPSKEDEEKDESEKKKQRKTKHVKGEIIFRKFQMDEMKNVSILFADIVGFTKMSSNKSAERLVGLLNDLFGRFDKLCNASGCEKISTLGDCYYCVSGCPNPCEDHAKCCVEMGLSMVIAIRAFDEDHKEEVNMRVGVHTGTVLCGIVGTVRFKFDVWSNDVTLANTMESTGEPGKVHISESTRSFLVDEYEMEEGVEVPDMRGRKELIEHYDPAMSSFTIKHREETRNIKTYFIIGRKPGKVGIPGLEQLADERPADLHVERAISPGSSPANSVIPTVNESNNETNDTTVDLFSKRIPDIMTSDDNRNKNAKTADQTDTATVDTSLLNKNRKVSFTAEQDKLLIELMEKENKNNEAFFKPKNLNKLTLTFDREMENIYRHEFKDSVYLRSHLFQENMLSSPRYQMTVEAAIAFIVLVVLAVACHIMFHFTCTLGLIVLTVVGLVVQALVFIDALTNIISLKAKSAYCPLYLRITLSWYFRNALGVILATIPSALVYLSMSCDLISTNNWHDRFFCFGVVVALLQYCNYSMLRSYAKSLMAIIIGSILIVLLFINICNSHFPGSAATPLVNASFFGNATYTMVTASSIANTTSAKGILSLLPSDNPDNLLFSGYHFLQFEIILSILLLLLLITILNYEFENSYRLSFHASVKAQKDKENMQLNKDQAEWLLHNIIPAHLAEIFKSNRSYSRNHQDVGVIFATIVNFNEFYDEMYAGGREYLRVLNELVSDYEVMLNEPRFKDVEKIKTISSSFMAAAGLNEESRAKNKNPYAHLYALMEFATELQVVVNNFNESIFNFNFILNIGYNYGPVTAGVIGTTKLLYDIWGDTVNIASRMYSTGEDNRIQVPQGTAECLSPMFDFSYRGEIFVKGKGMMKTYLLEDRKPGAHWD
ncbi:adenylate cyclase type 9-like isoform X4 [Biomphalaria glabrata]|uniref:Adenylate cyclase type 9 n=1 Tax=Biomphalaria glabrata TaxID=6526 RepID=A0A9W3B174_BIOGL|nr:adenylate cyclase type 9-like isoform X4 [Biomphalaria glabrata]